MHNTLGLVACVCIESVCRLAHSTHCYRKWNGRARCVCVCVLLVTLANTIHSAWMCGSMGNFYRGTERQSVRRSIYMLQCAESNIYYSFRISALSLCVWLCFFIPSFFTACSRLHIKFNRMLIMLHIHTYTDTYESSDSSRTELNWIDWECGTRWE